jgi:hypothetical protein
MFTITGHPVYRWAATPNAVALYISGDVCGNQPHGTFGATAVHGEVHALAVGQTATFRSLTSDHVVTVERTA